MIKNQAIKKAQARAKKLQTWVYVIDDGDGYETATQTEFCSYFWHLNDSDIVYCAEPA